VVSAVRLLTPFHADLELTCLQLTLFASVKCVIVVPVFNASTGRVGTEVIMRNRDSVTRLSALYYILPAMADLLAEEVVKAENGPLIALKPDGTCAYTTGYRYNADRMGLGPTLGSASLPFPRVGGARENIESSNAAP
jgi:hypothetical protein